MITGAAQKDGGILVVSSPDGPMPQTKEHIRPLTIHKVAPGTCKDMKDNKVTKEDLMSLILSFRRWIIILFVIL
nr:elongation factor Tu, mitochondrial [Tanacetum cinerariifolium]